MKMNIKITGDLDLKRAGERIVQNHMEDIAARLKRQRCSVHAEAPKNVRVTSGPTVTAEFCCEAFKDTALKVATH